ncbi:uncharacterized protein LOC134819761 isoform X2 [Bolinopsis microptera]|uniref:uncharacterized protein LOC134819761 isoform X2 n=1 Tax=Bolinopsis microptera TaxID=2820187 RepID=UPI00307A3E9C
MVKFLILVLSLVVLGQCCNYAKLEKIDRLMEQFLNLVEEKKYKYEAALMTYELMNYNEVEEDNPEDYAVAGELRDGLLGAGSHCDEAAITDFISTVQEIQDSIRRMSCVTEDYFLKSLTWHGRGLKRFLGEA